MDRSMSLIPADIQQQYAALAAIVANATLPEAVRRPAEASLADLQRQYPALGQPAAFVVPPTHTEYHGIVQHDQSQTQGVVAGVIAQSTINLFFGAQPPVDGERLLQEYLHVLLTDCNRLHLERMTEKRQTGGEHATTPTLKLQDVYTSLTTDGADIVVHEMDGTMAELRQFYDQQDRWATSPEVCDPRAVRRWQAYASDHPFVTGMLSIKSVGIPLNIDRPDPDETLTLRGFRPELAFDAIRQERRLVLLGEPGSGKSTVLRYLAVLLARRLQGEDVAIPGWADVDPLPIPIFCPLGQVAQALTATGNADAALWQTLGTVLEGAQPLRDGLRDYLKGALNRGGVILLCDGLDELPLVSSSDATIQPRRAIAQAMQNLARTAPQLRIVLTSRVKPYQASDAWRMPPEEDWATRTIRPLAFGQVRTFIQSWYHALIGRADLASDDDAAARSGQLIGEIEHYPRIHPLVESPLLLTMLTILHHNTDRIPRDRATLYHECVQLLLERWEPVRSSTNPAEERKLLAQLDIPDLSLDQLRHVIHELAFEAHDSPPTDDGRGLIDGEKLDGKLYRFFARLQCDTPHYQVRIFRNILEADAGLLQAPEEDRYAFPHLTFQEYLAACYLVDQIGLDQKHIAALAYTRWCASDGERWREVLLLMMGRFRYKGGSEVFRDGVPWLKLLISTKRRSSIKSTYQRQRDLVLAALSYAEIGGRNALANWDLNVEEELEGPLRNGLVELLADSDPQIGLHDRMAVATTLGQIGDPRFPITLEEWQHETFPITFGNSMGYWCYVPAGAYRVGGWKVDDPATNIDLPPYWIARFPITVAQFRLFAKTGYGPDARSWWTLQGWQWKERIKRTHPWVWDRVSWTGANQPVIGVTWYEAVAFANWLHEHMGKVLVGDYCLRLPTEAEWEVAAAYDANTARRTYPWGEIVPTQKHAIYNTSALGHPTPIGCCSQGKAACGALDMAGNVWEWSCSHGESYPAQSDMVVDNFEQSKSFVREEMVVPLRGGAFWDDGTRIGCASRVKIRPADQDDLNGFRVVVARCSEQT